MLHVVSKPDSGDKIVNMVPDLVDKIASLFPSKNKEKATQTKTEITPDEVTVTETEITEKK